MSIALQTALKCLISCDGGLLLLAIGGEIIDRPNEQNLFKVEARQRGTKLPPPLEFQTHCALADTITRWALPGWWWFHYPAGELRQPITAARLKRMGTKAGVADFGFFHSTGRVCWLELKRPGNDVSDEQADFLGFMAACGHGVALCWSYEQAVKTLIDWKVLRSIQVSGEGAHKA